MLESYVLFGSSFQYFRVFFCAFLFLVVLCLLKNFRSSLLSSLFLLSVLDFNLWSWSFLAYDFFFGKTNTTFALLVLFFSFFFRLKLCVCGDQEIINFPHEIIIELTPIHIYKFKLSSKYCLQQIQTIKFKFLHNYLVFSFQIVYFFT